MLPLGTVLGPLLYVKLGPGDADEKSALTGAGLAIITGIHSVVIAEVLVNFGVALKRGAVPGKGHGRDTRVGAVDIDRSARSAVVVVVENSVGWIVLRNEAKICSDAGADRRYLAPACNLFCSGWGRRADFQRNSQR
jgi:hypothetical protein